jgi:hypothetical protein
MRLATVPTDNYLGHPPELIAQAVVLPHEHFVQLDDMLFAQHGLGPRFAQVMTKDYRQHRSLSYSFWNLPGTNFDLITAQDSPQDIGSFEDLIADRELVHRLTTTFIQRTGQQPTPAQLALVLIRARAESLQIDDQLGAHRLVKWVLIYERRAHWISTHRQQAFAKTSIDWPALGL